MLSEQLCPLPKPRDPAQAYIYGKTWDKRRGSKGQKRKDWWAEHKDRKALAKEKQEAKEKEEEEKENAARAARRDRASGSWSPWSSWEEWQARSVF